MALFCKHDWKLLDKTVLPSPFQQLTKDDLRELKTFQGSVYYYQTAVVLTLACTKCGKLRHYRDTLFSRWRD